MKVENPSAFAVAAEETKPIVDLRDYFAASALTGLASDPSQSHRPYAYFADAAYGMADALLAARGE